MVPAFAFSVSLALLAKPLFAALRQPAELLPEIRDFSSIQAVGLGPQWLKEALNNILVSQCIVNPGMWIDAVSSVLNLAIAFILLESGSGYLGVAWACTAAQCIGFLLIVLYVVRYRHQATVWRVPSNISSLGQVSLRTYVLMMLPSAFSLWSEWWAAEVLAVLAGWLPGRDVTVAANAILLNTLAIFYMAFVGVQVATTTRIGNLVGAKASQSLPVSVAAGIALALGLALVTSFVLQIFGAELLKLWTKDLSIVAAAQEAQLGIVLSVPPYSVMMCLLGVLRGAGLQLRGAIAVFFSFYMVGLPLGAYLGVHMGVGLMGIWWGNITGLSLSAAILGIQIYFIDWERVVADAQGRAEIREVTISLADGNA